MSDPRTEFGKMMTGLNKSCFVIEQWVRSRSVPRRDARMIVDYLRESADYIERTFLKEKAK